MADTLAQRVERLEKLIHGEEVSPIENFITVQSTGLAASALGGMEWLSQWNRETPYAVNDVVKYNGHIYICIQAVTGVTGVTGLGPIPGVFKEKNWFLPGGRLKPMGRIAPGEPFGGLLHSKDSKFEEYNQVVEDAKKPGPPTFVAHVWEFWVKEIEAKTTIKGFGAAEGNTYHTAGRIHATIGNDGGENRKAEMINTAGEMTEGLMELQAATATKVGGNERYYLIVWGGTWQEQGENKEALHVTFPLPYLLTPGAGIVAGPGNVTPPTDFEHWELVI